MIDQDYNEATYGNSIAEVYDEWYPEPPADMIRTLTDLAGAGPALELGIGTGRVALPLLSGGVEIHGIDASEAMVARLKSRPGGDRIPVTIGNFADVAVDGNYSMIFVVFNTFFSLLSQEEQVKCFANIAGRLQPEGLFVIEASYPIHAALHRARSPTSPIFQPARSGSKFPNTIRCGNARCPTT